MNYEKEACRRWGNTDAFCEYQKKTNQYSKEQWSAANDGLMAIFGEFAECKKQGFVVDSSEAQILVKYRNRVADPRA